MPRHSAVASRDPEGFGITAAVVDEPAWSPVHPAIAGVPRGGALVA